MLVLNKTDACNTRAFQLWTEIHTLEAKSVSKFQNCNIHTEIYLSWTDGADDNHLCRSHSKCQKQTFKTATSAQVFALFTTEAWIIVSDVLWPLTFSCEKYLENVALWLLLFNKRFLPGNLDLRFKINEGSTQSTADN